MKSTLFIGGQSYDVTNLCLDPPNSTNTALTTWESDCQQQQQQQQDGNQNDGQCSTHAEDHKHAQHRSATIEATATVPTTSIRYPSHQELSQASIPEITMEELFTSMERSYQIHDKSRDGGEMAHEFHATLSPSGPVTCGQPRSEKEQEMYYWQDGNAHAEEEMHCIVHATWDGPATVAFANQAASVPPPPIPRSTDPHRQRGRRRRNHRRRRQHGRGWNERVEIEVAEGHYQLLRGAIETMEAIELGNGLMVHCVHCYAVLICVADCELVVCPDCLNFSPIEAASDSYNLSIPEIQKQKGEAGYDLVPATPVYWELENDGSVSYSSYSDKYDEFRKSLDGKQNFQKNPSTTRRSGVGLGLKMA